MSTPTLYCAMPAESLGSSPDFRLMAAFLPPPGVAGRLLKRVLVGRRITAMELDHRIFDQIGLPTELLTTPQLGVRHVRRSVLMTIRSRRFASAIPRRRRDATKAKGARHRA